MFEISHIWQMESSESILIVRDFAQSHYGCKREKVAKKE